MLGECNGSLVELGVVTVIIGASSGLHNR
jgi:hypothetical protein